MRNNSENGKAPSEGVLPAVAQFFNRYSKNQIIQAPATVQEMFNDLMLTELANDRPSRERWHMALLIISDFGNAIAPFPEDEIDEFVTAAQNV